MICGNYYVQLALVRSCSAATDSEVSKAMKDRQLQSPDQLDRKSSLLICRAIGDRLRQDLGPEPAQLPSNLQHLMEEMSRQEKDSSSG